MSLGGVHAIPAEEFRGEGGPVIVIVGRICVVLDNGLFDVVAPRLCCSGKVIADQWNSLISVFGCELIVEEIGVDSFEEVVSVQSLAAERSKWILLVILSVTGKGFVILEVYWLCRCAFSRISNP
jgi:hypothetical protein